MAAEQRLALQAELRSLTLEGCRLRDEAEGLRSDAAASAREAAAATRQLKAEKERAEASEAAACRLGRSRDDAMRVQVRACVR